MRPRPLLLVVAAGLAGLLALAALGAPSPKAPTAAIEVGSASPSATASPLVVVDVQGAVVRPGVYRLRPDARIADALAAAGGLLPEADPSGLNRAAILRDGSRVYAPRLGEVPPAGALGSESERDIDLNHASAAELASLPGIGPSTAERIIRSRERAPFRAVDELQTRGLLSPRVLADIRDRLTTR